MKFVFSGQILDADLRELRRNGELVPVEPQVFDLLVYLLKNRDRVVSKDDLIAGGLGRTGGFGFDARPAASTPPGPPSATAAGARRCCAPSPARASASSAR